MASNAQKIQAWRDENPGEFLTAQIIREVIETPEERIREWRGRS